MSTDTLNYEYDIQPVFRTEFKLFLINHDIRIYTYRELLHDL